MADIFISYAKKNHATAQLLADALVRKGWSVWWDRTLLPGDHWEEVIEAELSAARCVIVLWSKDSVASDWVKYEAGIGLNRGILVPARIDEVEIDKALPEFREIQAADLTDWPGSSPHDGFDDLFAVVLELLHRPPKPFHRYWNLLLLGVVWLLTTVGGFSLPAPSGLVGNDQTLVMASRVVVSVLLGLMVLPMIKWRGERRHAWFWGKVAAVVLVLGLSTFLGYQQLLNAWAVDHHGRVLYVGTEVKPDILPFMQAHPGLTNEELLENAGWDPGKIWTQGSLQRCRLLLAGLYVFSTPLFALGLLAVAQLIHCLLSRK